MFLWLSKNMQNENKFLCITSGRKFPGIILQISLCLKNSQHEFRPYTNMINNHQSLTYLKEKIFWLKMVSPSQITTTQEWDTDRTIPTHSPISYHHILILRTQWIQYNILITQYICMRITQFRWYTQQTQP